MKEVQTTPDGVRTVTRAYDADSRETTVICGSAKIEKTFDKLGRLSSIRRNGGKHTTTYTYGTAADRQEELFLLNIRMVNSHRSRAMAMMTGAMFPEYQEAESMRQVPLSTMHRDS